MKQPRNSPDRQCALDCFTHWKRLCSAGALCAWLIVAFSAASATDLLLEKRPGLRPWRHRRYVLRALYTVEQSRTSWRSKFGDCKDELGERDLCDSSGQRAGSGARFVAECNEQASVFEALLSQWQTVCKCVTPASCDEQEQCERVMSGLGFCLLLARRRTTPAELATSATNALGNTTSPTTHVEVKVRTGEHHAQPHAQHHMPQRAQHRAQRHAPCHAHLGAQHADEWPGRNIGDSRSNSRKVGTRSWQAIGMRSWRAK